MTHPKEVVAVSVMILVGAWFIFLLIYKPKRKVVTAQVAQDSIVSMYDYHLKMIQRLPLDEKRIKDYYSEIKHFDLTYEDHEMWFELSGSLKDEIQIKLNDTWLFKSQVISTN